MSSKTNKQSRASIYKWTVVLALSAIAAFPVLYAQPISVEFFQPAMAQGQGQYDPGQAYQGNPANNGQYPNQGYQQQQQPYYAPQGQPAAPGQTETFNAQQQPYPQYQQQQPPYQQPLQGQVAVIGAGTQFQAALINTLDSGVSQPGERVEATLGQGLMGSNGGEAVPAGSVLTGSITNVVSAKRFKFGANGKIDIKFTSLRTPDGRVFPLSASVDGNQVKLVGGSTAGRIGKGVLTTGIGAGGGAALGTGLGAIVGATSHGQVGRATGMGAVFGTAIGGGVGLIGAGVRKGSEVIFKAGQSLPVKLDQSMQVTVASQPYYPPQNYQQPPQYQQPPMQQSYQQQPMQPNYQQPPQQYQPPPQQYQQAPQQYQQAPQQYSQQQQQAPRQPLQQPAQELPTQPVWTPGNP